MRGDILIQVHCFLVRLCCKSSIRLNSDGKVKEVNGSGRLVDVPGQDTKVVDICLKSLPSCFVSGPDSKDIVNVSDVKNEAC